MKNSIIRRAMDADVPAMVALSERARDEYATFEPEFFRKAAGAASAQSSFFKHLLASDRSIALLSESAGVLDGFAIATLIVAPPVYEPGGLTALVDDFTVRENSLWDSVGAALLDEVAREARARRAAQVATICAHGGAKREFLVRQGLAVVSEWWMKRL